MSQNSSERIYAVDSYSSDESYFDESENLGINQIIDIYSESEIQQAELQKFFVYVFIEGKKQIFEVDSGAGYTLIPTSDFDKLKLNVKIQKTNISFRSYTGDIFVPLGYVEVNVRYKQKNSIEQLFIVDSKQTALLGRVWIRHLKIDLKELYIDNFKECHIRSDKKFS